VTGATQEDQADDLILQVLFRRQQTGPFRPVFVFGAAENVAAFAKVAYFRQQRPA
jgi:hypothetical protein